MAPLQIGFEKHAAGGGEEGCDFGFGAPKLRMDGEKKSQNHPKGRYGHRSVEGLVQFGQCLG